MIESNKIKSNKNINYKTINKITTNTSWLKNRYQITNFINTS